MKKARTRGAARAVCGCAINALTMYDHGLIVGGVNEGKRLLVCGVCRTTRVVETSQWKEVCGNDIRDAKKEGVG